MLKADVAAKRLQEWKLSEDDDLDRYVPQALKLPKGLKPIGLALLGRGKDGEDLDWQETRQHQRKSAVDLDALAPRERTKLLALFFPKMAEHVESAWQLLKTTPYQVGYSRKSFRAPGHPAATLASRINWLTSLMGSLKEFQPEQLTVGWLAQWAPYALEYCADEVGPALAAAINAGGRRGTKSSTFCASRSPASMKSARWAVTSRGRS